MKFKGIKNQIKKTARFVIAGGFIVFMTCVTVCADDGVTWQTDPGKVVLDDPPVALSLPGYDHVVTRANVYEKADAISCLGMSAEEFLESMTQEYSYIYAWDYNYTKEFQLQHYFDDESKDVISLNGMSDEEIEEKVSRAINVDPKSDGVEIFDGEVYSSLTGDKYYLCRLEPKESIDNLISYGMVTVRENHIYWFYLTNLNGEAPKQELKNIIDSVEYFDELAKDPSRADNGHQSDSSKGWIYYLSVPIAATIAGTLGGIVGRKRKRKAAKEQARLEAEQAMKEQEQNADESVERENPDNKSQWVCDEEPEEEEFGESENLLP